MARASRHITSTEDLGLGKAAREEFALEYIRGIRARDPGIGGVKLWHMYRKEFSCDGPIGRDRFCRIIDENRLKVRQRRRKPRTTDSTHGLPTYPNLVKDFIPSAPNQLWISDITYIQVMDGACGYHFCYLSLILDAYSEEIAGWSVGPTLDTEYPIAALRMALKRIEGKGSGGRLLQQPPTAHEHRHDDSGRGLRDIRGQGYEMEELQDDGNKKQE